MTLDHLSNGRVVLGVGLGDDFEYEAFGEPLDGRGARLDEALVVLQSLLSGEAVDFEGDHFVVHSPPALPRPVQESIPIWVGGHWPNPAPFARAARYDGVVPRKVGMERGEVFSVDDLVAHPRRRAARRRLRLRHEWTDRFPDGHRRGPGVAGGRRELVVGISSIRGASIRSRCAHRVRAGPPRP